MYQDEDYNPIDPNDIDNEMTKEQIIEQTKKLDRGYNSVYRMVQKKDGEFKRKKIDIYTSGDVGSRIRDAETGEYYPYLVGSKDEYIFFKVGLSTGECKSSNGSNTLFYASPHHYMSHLHTTVSDNIISEWEVKHNDRLAQIKSERKNKR